MAESGERPRSESVWTRMEDEETERLAAGRLAVDDIYDRHRWAWRAVHLGFLIALVMGVAFQQWRVVVVLITSAMANVAARYFMRAEGRRRQRSRE